jgi:hypothetical protein
MKTYTKINKEPKLIIEYDTDADSPRLESDNIGYFFTTEGRYLSPDGTEHKLYEIMVETAEEAKDTDTHIALIKDRAQNEFEKSNDEDLHVIDIYPIYRYEHGSVMYKRGTAGGFDYSNCGFYIVTAKRISGQRHTTESIEKAIDGELETYTQWANGEVYRFTLLDDEGEQVDGCGGLYDIEDVREYLPTEDWDNEKLSDYLI